jgi:hypothetical protein
MLFDTNIIQILSASMLSASKKTTFIVFAKVFAVGICCNDFEFGFLKDR